MGQFDIEQLGFSTLFAQHFGSLKLLGKEDVESATWAHVNGYIDAWKFTEIFRDNLHSRVSEA